MDPLKYYHILEIDHSATLEEARQAYRDLIAVWHPDRYTHNPRLQAKALEKMKTVNAAFDIVSRHIADCGPGAVGPSPIKPAPSVSAAKKKASAARPDKREAVWARTEGRLAALARAKKISQAQKAARDQEAARIAATEGKKRAAAKLARRQAENRTRVREKEAAKKERLKKKQDRERAWAETEQKLRALKRAREKAAAERSRNRLVQKEKPVPLRWYIKQILICCGILFIALSGNTFQSTVHISFGAMLTIAASGFLAWWVVARLKLRDRLKK